MSYKISLGQSSASDAASLFQQQGALWIDQLFSRRFVQRLSKVYFRKYASLSQQELESRYACVGDQRYMITTEVKGKFNSPDLYANGHLMPILQELLGRHFVISSFGSVIAFPGAGAQSVHMDYPPLYEDESTCTSLPPHAITLVVPLVDLNEKTGSTSLWLGTHNRVGAREQLQKLVETGSRRESVFPSAKLGDAYLMDFRLTHAGMANQSEIARPILYIVYSRPWFDESLNFSEQPRINLSRKQYGKVPKALRYLFAGAAK
ncbi:phytanoyl-CoA dioxygenase family protein [Planctomycetes bacterium K23_9]|uniref:Kanamycin B dioxygenase n=1 Tax=Stieleria marina TaxID=1930275 RepID=A0A517NW60_9BACT|nr:Kanamycin B dioxygenase [Planctomycetes bacterium K23_9]